MGNSVTPEISMRELRTKNWGAEILLSCIRRLPITSLYMYHCHTMHKCVCESMTLYCRYGMTLFTIFGDTQSTWVHLKCTMHTNELHCYSEFNFLAAQIYIEFETKRESNREIWKEGQRERESGVDRKLERKRYASNEPVARDTRLFAMQMLTIHTIYTECCITLLCTIWKWIARQIQTHVYLHRSTVTRRKSETKTKPTNGESERERERESNKNKSGYVEMRSGNKTHCNGKFWVKSAMQTVMHVDAL